MPSDARVNIRIVKGDPVRPTESREEPAWPIHPVGTVGVCEGRLGVVIGKDGGARRWQWLNGDWTAIPLGTVTVIGSLLPSAVSQPDQPLEERP